MVSGVEAHMGEVNSCLYTLHPDKYDPIRLLLSHQIIANAVPETCSRIESIIDRYPSYPQPYLWRGLQRRKQGMDVYAVRDLVTACRLDTSNDWQPWFWLSLIFSQGADTVKAVTAAQETLSRCPEHPCAPLLLGLIEGGLGSAMVPDTGDNPSQHPSVQL